jgi:endonuclease/exonuclease/phosphatase family metal-dependent hydrolase
VSAATVELTVATYNLLNRNVHHAKNYPSWNQTTLAISAWARREQIYILCTQEGVPRMISHLQRALSSYTVIGAPRSLDPAVGETASLFFKADRFELIDYGQFWLSEQPRIFASKGGDSALPRIATWLKLQNKFNAHKIIVLNTHFDHHGRAAKANSASLIAEQLRQINPEGLETLICGNFNVSANHQSLRPISENFTAAPLHDEPTHVSGSQIDHIFYSRQLQLIGGKVQRPKSNNKKDLSNHFAVTLKSPP